MTPEWDEPRGATGLEPTEGLLRAITTSVADALYVVDQDERVLYTNPAGLRMLGYDDLSQLVGRVSHETIHYMHADGTPFPAADCPLLEPKRGGGMVRVEDDHFIRRDGSFVPVAYSSAPLVLRSGIGAVVAFRDLTPRLRLEAAARMGEIQRVRAEDLEASRARIAHAADAAMRQIERDLHDGAQQRLGAIAVRLEVIRKTLETNPADAARMLEQTQAELLEALRELRAAGTRHPPRHPPRTRSRGGDTGAGDARTDRGRDRARRHRLPSGVGRVGGLLRERRGALERRSTFRSLVRHGRAAPRARRDQGDRPR